MLGRLLTWLGGLLDVYCKTCGARFHPRAIVCPDCHELLTPGTTRDAVPFPLILLAAIGIGVGLGLLYKFLAG